MTRIALSLSGILQMLRRRLVSAITGLMLGAMAGFIILNADAPEAVIVNAEGEAIGPEFSDVGTLDLVFDVKRIRVCPSQTQRWAWRWTVYHGRRAQQFVPLATTELPALADDGTMILTIPSTQVPEPITGQWFYRSVTAQRCGFLPAFLWRLIGPTVSRSADIPVNFVGAPHGVNQ